MGGPDLVIDATARGTEMDLCSCRRRWRPGSSTPQPPGRFGRTSGP